MRPSSSTARRSGVKQPSSGAWQSAWLSTSCLPVGCARSRSEHLPCCRRLIYAHHGVTATAGSDGVSSRISHGLQDATDPQGHPYGDDKPQHQAGIDFPLRPRQQLHLARLRGNPQEAQPQAIGRQNRDLLRQCPSGIVFRSTQSGARPPHQVPKHEHAHGPTSSAISKSTAIRNVSTRDSATGYHARSTTSP